MDRTFPAVILASKSPRRAELIRQIIKDFQVIPSELNEICDAKLSPEENVEFLGRQKAIWVANQHPDHWVVGADTIVVLENKIIGKPNNAKEAHKTLRKLSGREHKVLTGITIVHTNILSATTTSTVRFKPLSDSEIVSYINSGEPMDKAGAYAIQGKGSSLIESYKGSYSNIVGLPIETLTELLKKSGFPFNKSR